MGKNDCLDYCFRSCVYWEEFICDETDLEGRDRDEALASLGRNAGSDARF